MMGKASAIFGPLLVGVVAGITGDTRLSILSILLLFIGGAALLVIAARAERRSARVAAAS
jgi:UMF1 family MFS transporter